MKLLDFAWGMVTTVGQKDHHGLRMLLDEDFAYPSLSADSAGYALKVPLPKAVKGGFRLLHGMYFDQDENSWTSLWRLFKASLFHLSLHAAYSDFREYAPWARGKDTPTAIFAVSLVEDYKCALKGARSWPGIMGDLAYANYVSSLRLPDPDRIVNLPLRFAAKLLLSLWGVGRPDSEENDAEAREVAALVRKGVGDAVRSGRKEMLVEAAERGYAAVSSRGLLREVPFLPYTESHGDCELFDSTVVGHESGEDLLRSASVALQAEPTAAHDRASAEEAKEFQEAVKGSEQKISTLRQHYEDVISVTRLDSVEIPKGDYSAYLRVRSSLAGPIRTIRDQLRLIANELDETAGHESGQVDTQTALQVLASGQMRSDVFLREEAIRKNEAWAILVDSSKSTAGHALEVRGITACLAEVAQQLIPARGQWGAFGFNSSFQIIKDFNEEYSSECKARIGGMAQRSATLLPDALLTCSEALGAMPVETRILVVASDGHPSGYGGIEENLVSAIKRISKSGVLLMGVGIDSDAVKDYFAVNCVLSSPYEMMKTFVRAYLELSSMF